MRGVHVVVGFLLCTLALGLSPVSTASQATPVACPATTEDENVALARRFHEEAINQRNVAALQDILHPQLVHHAAGGFPDVTSADDVTTMMAAFPEAFSDLHYEFDLFIVQDDFVVERYTASGTQDGPLQDLPPSDRKATWTGINIFRIECGQIVEIWSEVDALSRTQQLTGATTATPAP
jgi:predicted ester cyclase